MVLVKEHTFIRLDLNSGIGIGLEELFVASGAAVFALHKYYKW